MRELGRIEHLPVLADKDGLIVGHPHMKVAVLVSRSEADDEGRAAPDRSAVVQHGRVVDRRHREGCARP
jgi:hypothetical protein